MSADLGIRALFCAARLDEAGLSEHAQIVRDLHTALEEARSTRGEAIAAAVTTEREARHLVAMLRTEALRVVADARKAPGDSLETAARQLGVSRRALATWLAAGGWLA